MVDHPSELPVPLADVETAQRIADAARAGRPVDRSPTVEQLMAAFGEDLSTGPGTRVRVEQALKLAGVGVSPPLADLPEGTRVFLTPGRGPSGSGGAKRVLLGLLALAVLIGGATAAALTLGDDGGGRASSLPAGTATGPATGTTGVPGSATTGSTPASATSTPSTANAAPAASTPGGVSTPADSAADATAAADQAAADRKAADRKAAADQKRRAAERKRRRQAAERRAAAARRTVVVSVQPREPTYLCAKNGAGRVLFAGTLTRKQVFKSGQVRLNIGTSSAIVRIRGNVFALGGSPAGVLAQAGGKKPVALPSGQRPSC